jgi:putative Holliday junction resolvase
MMMIAALDVSTTRIGVAVCDRSINAVHPISTIVRSTLDRDLAQLRELLIPRAVDKVIVGLPINMDGSEGPAARRMRSFAARLGQALAIPIELHDERLTTFEARDRMRDLPATRSRRRKSMDSIAAALILEAWLEANPSPTG